MSSLLEIRSQLSSGKNLEDRKLSDRMSFVDLVRSIEDSFEKEIAIDYVISHIAEKVGIAFDRRNKIGHDGTTEKDYTRRIKNLVEQSIYEYINQQNISNVLGNSFDYPKLFTEISSNLETILTIMCGCPVWISVSNDRPIQTKDLDRSSRIVVWQNMLGIQVQGTLFESYSNRWTDEIFNIPISIKPIDDLYFPRKNHYLTAFERVVFYDLSCNYHEQPTIHFPQHTPSGLPVSDIFKGNKNLFKISFDKVRPYGFLERMRVLFDELCTETGGLHPDDLSGVPDPMSLRHYEWIREGLGMGGLNVPDDPEKTIKKYNGKVQKFMNKVQKIIDDYTDKWGL